MLLRFIKDSKDYGLTWGLASASNCFYVVQIQLEEEAGVRLNLSQQKTALNKLSRWKSTKNRHAKEAGFLWFWTLQSTGFKRSSLDYQWFGMWKRLIKSCFRKLVKSVIN